MSMYFNIEDVENRLPDGILETLIGGTYDFYGVDDKAFCIGVNGSRMVLEAIEDPSDGYRSYFGCFCTPEVGKIFFGQPIARVRLEVGGRSSRSYCFCDGNDPYDSSHGDHPCPTHLKSQLDNFNGWTLIDVDTGHTWLTVGTDHGDDYYPCFTFNYSPDPSKKIELSHD